MEKVFIKEWRMKEEDVLDYCNRYYSQITRPLSTMSKKQIAYNLFNENISKNERIKLFDELLEKHQGEDSFFYWDDHTIYKIFYKKNSKKNGYAPLCKFPKIDEFFEKRYEGYINGVTINNICFRDASGEVIVRFFKKNGYSENRYFSKAEIFEKNIKNYWVGDDKIELKRRKYEDVFLTLENVEKFFISSTGKIYFIVLVD